MDGLLRMIKLYAAFRRMKRLHWTRNEEPFKKTALYFANCLFTVILTPVVGCVVGGDDKS